MTTTGTAATQSRITNEDAIGDYLVVIIAFKNRVNSFSVKTLEDAQIEAQRIVANRATQGKPIHEAFARQILDRRVVRRQRYLTFGERIPLKTL